LDTHVFETHVKLLHNRLKAETSCHVSEDMTPNTVLFHRSVQMTKKGVKKD